MQQSFSREFMESNCGCYELDHLNACSFMASDPISLVSIITSEIPLKDKYWFVCKKLATKEQNQQISIDVAEMVLPVFEKRYPDDKRPREAIAAARAYISGHISAEKLLEKRRAATAAYAAAAAAAAAADAAAYATADAAAYATAAYAAAYAAAAYAAAYDAAAYAAAYAAADAAIKQQLLTYLINLCSPSTP